MAIDRLSALPDTVLTCNIFSRLSLRDAVRTSLLSTRWRSLWKQIPHLDFSREFFRSVKFPSDIRGMYRWNQILKFINDIIDGTLLLHSGHIESFSIHISEKILFVLSEYNLVRLHVEQWIHHLSLKGVKHISLTNFCLEIDVPPSLFACHLLRHLELDRFKFRGIPTDFDGFRSLQSCSLSQLRDLTDDGLKQLIGLCPLLRELVLVYCWGFINLKIQAPNLTSLKIESCSGMKSLTADCPQLVEVAIEECFHLIEFKMNSCVIFHDLHTSYVRTTKEQPMLNSLRKLSVKACRQDSGLTLLTNLGYFHNLEEVHLKIFEDACYSEQEREKGEVAADSTFSSLKKACVDISSAMNKEETIVLAFLLKNAPSLHTITVTLPYCPANIHDKEFINKVKGLRQIYEKVDIRMEIDEDRDDVICQQT